MIAPQPKKFETIQQFFSKFKSLFMQCKQCGIDKKDEPLVISILSKLGPEFPMFISTFHSGRMTTPNWRIPSLDAFIESLIHEQYKMIHMGALNSSKNQALFARESKNAQAKGKKRGKKRRTLISILKRSRILQKEPHVPKWTRTRILARISALTAREGIIQRTYV